MSHDVRFYAFLAFYVVLAAILLHQLLQWIKAARLHPRITWLASREAARCWILTGKRWMLYACVVGFCIVCVALYEFRNGIQTPLVFVAYFCVIALSTISWNSLPPSVLFLASSSPEAGTVLNVIRRSTSAAGLRTVYLLNDTAIIPDFEPGNTTFKMGNLRVLDDSLWKDVVHRLCIVTPVIVIDTRIVTDGVIHELQHLFRDGLLPRTLLIINKDGSAPALIASGCRPTCQIKTTTPSSIETNLKRIIRDSQTLNPADAHSLLMRSIRDGDASRGSSMSGFIKKAVRALCALGLFIMAYAILSSPIVNAPKNVEPALHAEKLRIEGQSRVIVLRHEARIEEATWGIKMGGASTAGIALSFVVSLLLPSAKKKGGRNSIKNPKSDSVQLRRPIEGKSLREESNDVPKHSMQVNDYEIDFVQVEGGTFKMGSNIGDSDARMVHDVTVAAFRIGRHPIRVADFDRFVQASGYRTIAEIENGAYVWDGARWNINSEACWHNPLFDQSPSHPVTCVTWYDAVSFCNWLSVEEGLAPCYKIDSSKQDPNNHYPEKDARWTVACDFQANGFRLPTESEWEYAARGGAMSKAFRYAGSNDPETIGWFMQNAESIASTMMRGKVFRTSNYKNLIQQLNTGTTQAVGLKKANELGLHDMSGNVREWCWDWYAPDYYGCSPGQNPKGPSSGSFRVSRGGSWQANDLSHLETTYRNYGGPGVAFTNFGFRIVVGDEK